MLTLILRVIAEFSDVIISIILSDLDFVLKTKGHMIPNDWSTHTLQENYQITLIAAHIPPS